MRHAVLCKQRIKVDPSAAAEHDVADSTLVGVSYAHSKELSTVMQVVHARLQGTEVSIMFDSGSDRFVVTDECARRMKLKVVGRELLNHTCFGENVSKEEEKKVFELNVEGNRIHLMSMKHICTPMYRSAIPQEVLAHFDQIPFYEDYSKGKSIKIDILIGLDWYWSLIRSKRGNPSDGLIAQETVIGWMLSGVYSGKRLKGECGFKSQILVCQKVLADNLVRQLWDIESIGISKDEVSNPRENDEDTIMMSFSGNIDYREERYTVKLPWKDEQCKASMMDIRDITERRLISLNRKLKKNQSLKERYDSVFKVYEKGGIIRENPDHELEKTENPIFYLPHRPVVREDSLSTKVRPVFDASCKATNGISLNDCMEVGPKLIPDLVQILLRFRTWKFGLTADIQKAFLQIKLHEADQDVHRFLRDVNGHIRTMKFERVCFGNACSPFLLNATIKHHLEKFPPSSTLRELNNNLYVDGWITGADSEEDILRMMTDADEIMRHGGFVLTKWNSSCRGMKEEF